jgi:hypothetical protein
MSHEDFVKTIEPALPATTTSNFMAILKRTHVMVNYKSDKFGTVVYYRKAGEDKRDVPRVFLDDQDYIKPDAKHRIGQWKKGTRDFGPSFESEIAWEQRWLAQLKQDSVIPEELRPVEDSVESEELGPVEDSVEFDFTVKGTAGEEEDPFGFNEDNMRQFQAPPIGNADPQPARSVSTLALAERERRAMHADEIVGLKFFWEYKDILHSRRCLDDVPDCFVDNAMVTYDRAESSKRKSVSQLHERAQSSSSIVPFQRAKFRNLKNTGTRHSIVDDLD